MTGEFTVAFATKDTVVISDYFGVETGILVGQIVAMQAEKKTVSCLSAAKGEENSIMKTVRVVAAVICNGNKIFATARGYGDFKGQWEFPGGKIEAGESPRDALKREIREELAVQIEVGELIHTIEYDYPAFHLSMDCFRCRIKSGKLTLLEASDAGWFTKEELRTLHWLPADLELVDKIEEEEGSAAE